MKHITLLPLNPVQDATGFYRGMGPIAHLKRIMPEMEILFTGEQTLSWITTSMADVLFMQRPFTGEDARTIKAANRAGLPVWADYDDDLLAIPDDNPTSIMYHRPEIQRAFLQCLETADHVTFSTAALAARYGAKCRAHSVIPNAFPDHVIKARKPDEPVKRPEKECIMWRGSGTHSKDVWTVWKSLADTVAKHHPKYTLKMLGSWHWQVVEALGAGGIMVERLNALPVLEYYAELYKQEPRVMLVPLSEGLLNRSKSNIAWMEATYAGAMTIAPDWDEWRRPGVVNYDATNPASFAAAMEQVLAMEPWQVEQQNLAAWKLVWKNRLSIVNDLRRRVVETLAAKR